MSSFDDTFEARHMHDLSDPQSFTGIDRESLQCPSPVHLLFSDQSSGAERTSTSSESQPSDQIFQSSPLISLSRMPASPDHILWDSSSSSAAEVLDADSIEIQQSRRKRHFEQPDMRPVAQQRETSNDDEFHIQANARLEQRDSRLLPGGNELSEASGSRTTSFGSSMPGNGSAGHPELCRRPCIFFSAGKCPNTSSCSHCHLSHTQRVAHLDRWNRDCLMAMPHNERLGFLLPYLERRIKNSGLENQGQSFLEDLRSLLRQSSTPVRGPSTERNSQQLGKLKSAVQKLTVASMLNWASRGAPSTFDHELSAAIGRFRSLLAEIEPS